MPEEPRVVKGWLGWAVVGEDHVVYAKTREEALRRYWAVVGHPADDGQSENVGQEVEHVADDVRLADR
jgi:hypothetical protein